MRFYSSLRTDRLRVLLLTNAHNGLSQRARSVLRSAGHHVDVELALSKKHMTQAVDALRPELIICPMLTSRVPESIWKNPEVPCVIVHPGVQGDRGMSAIDWALRDRGSLGVTCLSAAEEMDAGPVWASRVVTLAGRDDAKATATKSSVYKNEITDAAIDAIRETVDKFQRGIKPVPVSSSDSATIGSLLPTMHSEVRVADFKTHAQEVARVIQFSDGQPGAKARLASGGEDFYVFDAHVEESGVPAACKGAPSGWIVETRNGAVLIACGYDSAVWIGQLRKGKKGIKLPASRVIDPSLMQLVHDSSSLQQTHFKLANGASWWKPPTGTRTQNDVWSCTVDRVCYVNFDLYNGAMGTLQSSRLRVVLERARLSSENDAIVLTGGYNTFSNGIALGEIVANEDPAGESWRSINAINDVVKEVFSATEKLTISALRGGAGAGGAMMSLAADRVWAHEGVILNPHYRTVGLHGSEYWTHFLPGRVGANAAEKVTSDCHALSAVDAVKIGLVDEVLAPNVEGFQRVVHSRVLDLVSSTDGQNILDEKKRAREKGLFSHLEKVRSDELAIMRQNFASTEYKSAAEKFVRKVKPLVTPVHLTSRRGQIIDGDKYAANALKNVASALEAYRTRTGERAPKLCIIIVGDRSDSKLYVEKKIKTAKQVGVDVELKDITVSESARSEALQAISNFNDDDSVDGIMVQLPITGINRNELLSRIDPAKDVDCLSPVNFHHILRTDCDTDDPLMKPPCPLGILELLIDHAVQLKGRHAAVIGSSANLGLPVAVLLEREGAQVTTININAGVDRMRLLLKRANIIVSTAGISGLVQPNMVKAGAVIVDAGISFDRNGKLFGDVAAECRSRAALVSPVPGGVGPVTIATLFKNLVANYMHRQKRKSSADEQADFGV